MTLVLFTIPTRIVNTKLVFSVLRRIPKHLTSHSGGEIMTSNQIAYWQLQEQIRSNKAKEADTDYANVETRRHNVATERNALNIAQETARHNRADESIKRFGEIEKQRTNLQNEAIKWYTASETERSNRAREAETHRSNIAQETETNRSNVVKETETNRHNLSTESANLAQVQAQATYQRRANEIAYYNYELNQQKLAEDVRWHDIQDVNTDTRNEYEYDVAKDKVDIEGYKYELDLQQRQHQRVMDWLNLGRNVINDGKDTAKMFMGVFSGPEQISLF